MSTPAPLRFRWDGEAMRPLWSFAKKADEQFCIGEVYSLVEHQEVSAASRGHYFASLHDAWVNLPEDQMIRFATVEHLRKWALISAGFRDERTIVCGSKAEAQRMAAFMSPLDEYAIIVPREATVTVWTAKSQSQKAMGRAMFQTSKEAVLDLVAEMIGVKADQLGKAHA